jgi:hypothetical protein
MDRQFVNGMCCVCAVKKNRNPDKEIYCHLVTATDTANVRTVFSDVKDIGKSYHCFSLSHCGSNGPVGLL